MKKYAYFRAAVIMVTAVAVIVAIPPWAVVVVPVVVALYLGFVFRTCPYRIEVIAASFFIGTLALFYKVAGLVLPFGPNI